MRENSAVGRSPCGKAIHTLFCLEIFSGSAGLTAALKRQQFSASFGLDAFVTKRLKAPVIKIDLNKADGQNLLWQVLKHPLLAFVHMGPPCGTASRARNIPLSKDAHGPPPLRSAEFPDGLPSLGRPC